MMDKVVSVKPLPDGVLWVEMSNGAKGEFDSKPYLVSDFFSALKKAD